MILLSCLVFIHSFLSINTHFGIIGACVCLVKHLASDRSAAAHCVATNLVAPTTLTVTVSLGS